MWKGIDTKNEDPNFISITGSNDYTRDQFNACVEYLNRLDSFSRSDIDNILIKLDELKQKENKSQGAIFINDLVKGLTGVNLNLEEEKEMKESKLKPGDWINISNLELDERKEIVQYMLDNGVFYRIYVGCYDWLL